MRAFFLAAASLAALSACSNAADSNARTAPENTTAGEVRPIPALPLDSAKTLTRIAFGSCAKGTEDQGIFDVIAAANPDLFLFIGDNVYGDVISGDPDLPELKAAYGRLADSEPFARLRGVAPMLTVWDDHDYGLNDAGAEFALKAQSEALFEDVWALTEDDPRRARDGVYGAWTIGAEEGRRVQIIMLDTRFFRGPLKPTDADNEKGKEKYIPNDSAEAVMLGEAQWAWLEEELEKPADLRVLVSSLQLLAEGHGFEAWRLYPAERARLYALIEKTGAERLIAISGDRHLAGLYRDEDAIGYPLTEATSSSLNLPSTGWLGGYVEPGPKRLGGIYTDANWGLLDIDWEAGAVGVEIRDAQGEIALARFVALSSLENAAE